MLARLIGYAVFLLILVGGLEIGFSIAYEQLTPEAGREIVRYLTQGEEASLRRHVLIPHPYMSYVNARDWSDEHGLQTNDMGYRTIRSYAREKPAGVVRILTLGGSTTFSWPYVSRPEKSWSGQLEQLLNDDLKAGREYEVLNGGLNSGTSAELLAHYLFRHRYMDLDIAIVHVGANDTAPLLIPGYQVDYSHYRKSFLGYPHHLRPKEDSLLKSALVRALYAWWFKDAKELRFALRSTPFGDYTAEQLKMAAAKATPVAFEENLSAMLDTMRADGVRAILFFVPWAPESVQAERGYPGLRFVEARRIAIEKNRAAMKRVAARYGAPYVEVPGDLIADEDFIDHVHLNEAGERVKAEVMKDAVERMLERGGSGLAWNESGRDGVGVAPHPR